MSINFHEWLFLRHRGSRWPAVCNTGTSITGYINLVARHFQVILKAIGIIGLSGGASLQLALVQDLINLLTLHLFCFYIYSARCVDGQSPSLCLALKCRRLNRDW